MKGLYLFLFLVFIVSCKDRVFIARSGSMEETIKVNERFMVSAVDQFERNDIVVYDYFGSDYSSMDEQGNMKMGWEKRIYRLVAYSGDMVEIRDGNILVNDRVVPPPPKGKRRYEVLSTVTVDEFTEMDPVTLTVTKRGDTIVYETDLTTEQASMFQQRKPAIVGVRKIPSGNIAADTAYARISADDKWSSYNYGPLKIPSPGETITVDPVNFKLYHNIPGISIGKHIVKEKLYFVIGDNFFGAEDSRYVGLISHSKMLGIVK